MCVCMYVCTCVHGEVQVSATAFCDKAALSLLSQAHTSIRPHPPINKHSTADGTRRTIRELNQAFLDSANYAAIEAVLEKTVGGLKDVEEGTAGGNTGAGARERRGGGGEVRRVRSESVVAKLVRPEKYPRSLLSLMYILSERQLRKVFKSREEIALMLLRNVRTLVDDRLTDGHGELSLSESLTWCVCSPFP